MRLIDADRLVKETMPQHKELIGTDVGYGMGMMLAEISAAPAIDAVPVVRCRECKNSMLWRKPTDKVIGECFIRKMNSDDEQFCMVGADDFCSCGERKDGDGDG